MPLDRLHAFADGPSFQCPTALQRLLYTFLHCGWGWHPTIRAIGAWMQFERVASVQAKCLLGPNAWCVNGTRNRERISLGSQTMCRGLLRIEQFGDGRISAGSRVYIGDDVLIASAAGIEIGDEVLIAHGAQIFDHDSHPHEVDARSRDWRAILEGGKRETIPSAPIQIGARAWIGCGALVLKGVTIGEGAVIAAGSVVTRSVPAGAVAAGNPATVVKTLEYANA